jgi:hypothetical protein
LLAGAGDVEYGCILAREIIGEGVAGLQVFVRARWMQR